MSAYLITYDLKTKGRDYSPLYEALKALGPWWHYLDASWLIKTTDSPSTIWKRLAPHITRNDFVLIIEVRDNAQGWLPPKAWEWIHANVPKPQELSHKA
jgi:hypothetical protein